MKRLASLAIAAVLIGALQFGAAGAGKAGPPPGAEAYYPDLRAVVPTHLNLINEHGRDLLRFSNGIANVGPGSWAIRAEHELGSEPTTVGYQQIRTNNAKYPCNARPKGVTECHEVLYEQPASVFEYHPAHHHWHTANAALFQIRRGSPSGPVVGSNSFKVGFCLIEVYSLEGNSATSERTFWDCFGGFQGASAGWVDQYHHATSGQQLNLTGLPSASDYYLVTTTDPLHQFLERDDTNNTAWVRFTLSGDAKGNRKVTVTGHSPCESPGLCGERSTNRG